MQDKVAKLDTLADIRNGSNGTAWLDRISFVFLLLMVLAAPHSIAAAQTAWIVGSLALIARLLLTRHLPFRPGLLDAALWGFFGWSVISSLVSYEPLISLDKLRGTAVFLVFYFVLYNLRNKATAGLLAFLLIGSCMVNVLWMPVERMMGRGVEINGLQPESPLAKALLWDGDTLLEVNGETVSDPDDVLEALQLTEKSKVKFYRPDFEFTVDVLRSDILVGADALQALGIGGWKASRNWRSMGFYGHYATYAEVLQLIGSLAFGLFLTLPGKVLARRRTAAAAKKDKMPDYRVRKDESALSHFTMLLLFAFAVAAIGFALLLTLTRAPQLGLLISAGTIVLLGLGRKWLITVVVLMLPIVIGGLIFLERSRDVGFFDPTDPSTQYRQLMLRDGLRLWTESPRHFIFGVGMDSIKENWSDWGLFDGGRQPLGHFHSTPVQLLVERGLPALLIWLIILGAYARSLWIGIRHKRSSTETSDWMSRGIFLGCFGGMIGFLLSGLVHYNFGDQEVAMVFFILMALGIKVASGERDLSDPDYAVPVSVRLAA